MANDKLAGYRDQGKPDPKELTPEERALAQSDREQQRENAKAEAEAVRQERGELEPEPGTEVPKGDEGSAPGQRVSANDRKALYKKSRDNRKELISREAEENIDVELVERMVAEAAGGDGDGSHLFDTNKTGRGEDRRAQPEAEPELTGEADPGRLAKGESEPATQPLTPQRRGDKVAVTILGQKFIVPQQDIDDAGGVEAYQKRRAADIKLLSIAQQEQYLNERWQQEEWQRQQRAQQDANLSEEDGQGKADVSFDPGTARKELLDIVAEGTNEDIEAYLKKLRSRPTPRSSQATTEPPPVSAEQRVAQSELDRQEESERIEANQLMRQHYADVLADPELLGLARQRFNALQADGYNIGRTKKELVREAAEFVRGLGRSIVTEQPRQSDGLEQERERRITQKRKIPQPSRADDRATQRRTGEQERKVPSAKEHFFRVRRAQGHDLPPPS